MCRHWSFLIHEECAHRSEPRLPLLPEHCEPVANALFHYHDQLNQPPQPIPLKMPRTCPPNGIPLEHGGNVWVLRLPGLCPRCKEAAELDRTRAYVSGKYKRERESQLSTSVVNTAMTTPLYKRSLNGSLPEKRDGPIIADSSIPTADEIEEGAEVGDVVYRKAGWELIKRSAATTPYWISYGWITQESPATLYPETPLMFNNEMAFMHDEWDYPMYEMGSPVEIQQHPPYDRW